MRDTPKTISVSRRHFSLVELLTVLAIIAVLLGLVVPNFSNWTRGSAVEIAARMLSSQLALARAEAITRRCRVAVLMYGKDFTLPASLNDKASQFGYASFRTAIVDNDNKWQEWIPGTSWNFLPQGALVPSVQDGTDTTPSQSILLDKSGTEPNETYEPAATTPSRASVIAKNDLKDHDENYRAVVFLPDGQCETSAVINICEGVSDPEDGDGFIRENFANCIVLQVNQYTGMVTYLYNGREE